jgi:hypothetical protein
MHGIGGDGEYCGDKDASGIYVPRTVFFKPGMIGAVRESPLGELFRPGNLVN